LHLGDGLAEHPGGAIVTGHSQAVKAARLRLVSRHAWRACPKPTRIRQRMVIQICLARVAEVMSHKKRRKRRSTPVKKRKEKPQPLKDATRPLSICNPHPITIALSLWSLQLGVLLDGLETNTYTHNPCNRLDLHILHLEVLHRVESACACVRLCQRRLRTRKSVKKKKLNQHVLDILELRLVGVRARA
jgi:hypothetical protein